MSDRTFQVLEINIDPVWDEIKKLAKSYERRLHDHPNIAANELLADPPMLKTINKLNL